MATISSLKILDCTIRDGGYVNNWQFDKKLVREVYRALSKAGVDIIEIGFHGTQKYFDREKYGTWRFSDEEDIREVTAGISGARLALMGDFGKIDVADVIDAKDSVIDIFRVAVHKNNLQPAINLLEKIKDKGYEVSLNAMGLSNYTLQEQKNLVDIVKSSNLDYFYVADSYGSIFPEQVKGFLEPFLEIPGIKVGFHPHNSLQMAFANTLEAIRCGVDIIDSTIYGMGRGAGNLATETIIVYLEMINKHKYNVVPILNSINAHFIDIQKENPWGYQLPYMLSGIFQCHPAYANTLVESREYTIEDIRKAMELIRKKDPVGFSQDILNEIINDGLIGGLGDVKDVEGYIEDDHQKPKVPYVNRHQERDFLVLANGPTLREYKGQIDEFIAKYDPIILGANYLGGLFKPHYHTFNNKIRFSQYVESVAPESNLLIGQHIPEETIQEYVARKYESLYYRDLLNADFDIVDGVIQTNCRTISVLLLGIAIVMGAKRVFAVGMDGYVSLDSLNGQLFYKEKISMTDKDIVIERHRWCQKFVEQIDEYLSSRGGEGINILTPTSYKACYKGIENYI
ncbi:aldolase catalytic domain-containing protein [Chloroflexota bacterium]